MARKQNTPVTGQILTQEERESYERDIAAFEQEEQRERVSPIAAMDASNGWGDLAGGMQQEIQISVCRAPTAHRGRETHLMRCTSAEYTKEELEDHIQATYGAGDYRIRGYYNGKLIEGLSFPFSCEDAPDTGREIAPVSQSLPSQAEMMQQQQFAMFQNMMGMQMQMMQGMAGLFANLAKPVEQPNMLEIMRTVKELMPQPVSTPTADPFSMVKEVLGLAKELPAIASGGSDRETSAMDVISQLINTAGPILESLKSQPRAPVQPVFNPNPTPRPVAQIAPPAAPSPQIVSPQMQFQQKPASARIDQFLTLLHSMINGGITPDAAADMINEQATDDEFAEIYEFMDAPGWIQKLQASDARFVDHTAWLENAKTALLSMLTDIDETPETGDTGTNIAAGIPDSDTSAAPK